MVDAKWILYILEEELDDGTSFPMFGANYLLVIKSTKFSRSKPYKPESKVNYLFEITD